MIDAAIALFEQVRGNFGPGQIHRDRGESAAAALEEYVEKLRALVSLLQARVEELEQENDSLKGTVGRQRARTEELKRALRRNANEARETLAAVLEFEREERK